MTFDEQHYLAEMSTLLSTAYQRWQTNRDDTPIFAISIWTDPEAHFSAVNIETKSHSDSIIAEAHAFARQARQRELNRGNVRMADLFLKHLDCNRNTNPADFEYREFATVQHHSFSTAWGTDAHCWDNLEPLLLRIRDMAKEMFKEMKFDTGAEISVNDRNNWYTNALPMD